MRLIVLWYLNFLSISFLPISILYTTLDPFLWAHYIPCSLLLVSQLMFPCKLSLMCQFCITLVDTLVSFLFFFQNFYLPKIQLLLFSLLANNFQNKQTMRQHQFILSTCRIKVLCFWGKWFGLEIQERWSMRSDLLILGSSRCELKLLWIINGVTRYYYHYFL